MYNIDATAIGIQYTNIVDLITFIIKAILGFSGAGFLIMILYGAFKYTTSQGDKAGVTEAQKTISSAVIGLAIASAFFAIISLLQTVLGVSLFNITI